jgi:hypothetical protein
MTLSSKRELIQAIRKVYKKSTKAQKGAHLDHLDLATGLKRNYLNRFCCRGIRRNGVSREGGVDTRATPSLWRRYSASAGLPGTSAGSC